MIPVFNSNGTDLVIVCRNKRQAKDLYERTCLYLYNFNHPTIHKRDILYVKDTVCNESARFVTVYELKHKYLDEDLDGLRMSGDFFDKWLDENAKLNVLTYEACTNALKEHFINRYLGR